MTMRTAIIKTMRFFHINRLAAKAYYGYFHGFSAANNSVLTGLDKCFAKVEEFDRPVADYLEFCLFKGYSFWYAQNKAKQMGLESMRFFGFDSFSGLPEPSEIDRTDVFYEGQYSCGKEDVVRNLDSKGVDWDRTHLIEGFFDVSLVPDLKVKYGMKSVSIALIDCDLYDSTRDVLVFLEDLIDENTILMFDDWNSFGGDESRGQRRAAREFLERVSAWRFEDFVSYGDYGQVFIVKRR
ncbi:MAG: TylF/MycF/NovP-related O-methyltransferase [Pseudomonadota bacterium]